VPSEQLALSKIKKNTNFYFYFQMLLVRSKISWKFWSLGYLLYMLPEKHAGWVFRFFGDRSPRLSTLALSIESGEEEGVRIPAFFANRTNVPVFYNNV
jgi:hypothetical protein